jgi:hypothetical protein
LLVLEAGLCSQRFLARFTAAFFYERFLGTASFAGWPQDRAFTAGPLCGGLFSAAAFQRRVFCRGRLGCGTTAAFASLFSLCEGACPQAVPCSLAARGFSSNFYAIPRQNFETDRSDCSLVEPVLYAFGIDNDLFGGVFLERVNVTQFFEDSSVTGCARVNCVDSEERPVPSSHSGHSDFY